MRGSRVKVGFPAPVAIRDASASYTATVHFDRGEGCKGVGAMAATDRDYAVGDQVELTLTLPRCKGKVSGTVSYSPGAAHGGGMPAGPGDPDNRTIGTFTTETQ